MKKYFFLVLTVIIAFMAISCNNALPKIHSITFNTQGIGTAPAALMVVEGSRLTVAQTPTPTAIPADKSFAGWCKDAACTQPWKHTADTVTGDITLYAKWLNASPLMPLDPSTPVYTVTFNTQGIGTAPAALMVVEGSRLTVAQTPAPTAIPADKSFAGWCKDAACTQPWNNDSDTVTTNMTLYAKWHNILRVTFNTRGLTPQPASLTVVENHIIPAADMPSPTHLTWDFVGWYKDKNCNTQWNTASDTVMTDITLYANWTPKNISAQNLWKSKETAGANNHFRIPALTQTKDGKLIAVTDLRYGHAADVGNFGGIHRVDLVMKHSTDLGHTWSDAGNVGENLTNVPNPAEYGCGDAGIVADRDSNEVLIIHVRGKVKYQDGKQSVYKLKSHDGGATWTSTDITDSIYGMNSEWQRMFVTSGKIYQSRYIKTGNYYRIYAAPLIAGFGNTVLYSDDFGDTWQVLGHDATVKPINNGDEAKVEELPDGRVILSSRAWHGRLFNIFTYINKDDGSGSWESSGSKWLDKGNDGGTNGEILILKAVRISDKTPATIALLSFPKTHSRQNVTVFWRIIDDNISLDDFADNTKWQEKLIKPGDSAYSTMILQSDSRIGFLYEADGISTAYNSKGYMIRYESLPISTITGGEYEAAFLTE